MAKGDADAAKNEQAQQTSRFQGQIDPFLSTASTAYNSAVPQARSDYKNIMGQYNNLAQTGGFSPQDITELRARAASPIRAAYGNAEQEIGRQRTLQGGYSPNATAALVKMARERGQAGSDAMTGVNASLAQMIQQGKLAGMQGMNSIYGATPGQASTFGNQVLQGIGTSANFGNEAVRNRIGFAGMPSNFQQAMGNLGMIGNLASGVAGAF